jgi:putative transposase
MSRQGLLHHSDQGSQYASDDYQKVLGAHGITCSMSRRGNCYDNAAMESWFSTLKFELGERYATRAEAKEKLFDYIEVFYNQHVATRRWTTSAQPGTKRLHENHGQLRNQPVTETDQAQTALSRVIG